MEKIITILSILFIGLVPELVWSQSCELDQITGSLDFSYTGGSKNLSLVFEDTPCSPENLDIDNLTNWATVTQLNNNTVMVVCQPNGTGGIRTGSIIFRYDRGAIIRRTITQGKSTAVPGKPNAPEEIRNPCGGPVVLGKVEPIPPGVSWYWQGTNPNGTTRPFINQSSYTVTTSGVYYLRAYRSDSQKWSVESSKITVTIKPAATDWFSDADNDGLGDPNVKRVECYKPTGFVENSNDLCPAVKSTTNKCTPDPPQAPIEDVNMCSTVSFASIKRARGYNATEIEQGILWYWQGKNENGTSRINEASDSYSVTESGRYFLRARNAGGNWSNSSYIDFVKKEIPSFPKLSDISVSVNCANNTTTFSVVSTIPSGESWFWGSTPDEAGSEIHPANVSKVLSNSWSRYYLISKSSTGCSSLPLIIDYIASSNEPPKATNPVHGLGCSSENITIGATPSVGNVIRWFTASTGGVSVGEGNSFVADNVTEPTSYFAESYNPITFCSASERLEVIINILPSSAIQNINPVVQCNDLSITISIPDNELPILNNWYWQETANGTLNTPANKSSEPITKTSGTVIYLRSISINGCWGVAYPISYSIQSNQLWYIDNDGDLHAEYKVESCSQPEKGTLDVLPIDDCYGDDPNLWEANTWYADWDNDTFGDPYDFVTQCEKPEGYVDNKNDLCPEITNLTNNCSLTSSPSNKAYIYTRTYQEEVDIANTQRFREDPQTIQDITYFDGLGRPDQIVNIDQSPLKQDILKTVKYDEFGRATQDFMAYSNGNGNPGSYKNSTIINVHKYYNIDKYENTLNPYSEKEFENSPLNRVLKQAAPGADWALGQGHEIEFSYGSNSFDPNDADRPENDNVRLFKVDLNDGKNSPELAVSGFYAPNQLYKTITRDENHNGTTSKLHTTEDFKDKQGRVVLKRTYALIEGAEAPHDTYYVYDDYGNLTYVLPPKVDTSAAITEAILEDLCYQYTYDNRNRLVEKQIPGKEVEYIVYNKLDQPVLTQDANMREGSGADIWLFTNYDAFGRVAYTGKLTYLKGTSRAAVQQEVDGYSQELWVSKTAFTVGGKNTIAGTDIYYSSLDYSGATITELLTINYYDTHEFDLAGLTIPTSQIQGQTWATNLKGLATGSKVRVLTTAQWITTLTHYDHKGRPIYTASSNPYLGTVDIVESVLDFVGKADKTKSLHTKEGKTIGVLDSFTYDHVGRLLSQSQCIGDQDLSWSCGGSSNTPSNPIFPDSQGNTPANTIKGTQSITLKDGVHLNPGTGESVLVQVVSGAATTPEELIVYNEYDELGQLENKKVGGAVNSTNIANSNGLQEVAYGYNIRGWLKNINDVANTNKLFNFKLDYNTGSGVHLYNGNISATSWRTANTDDNSLKSYTYNYDALNRITGASGTTTSNYDVSGITYDKMGNIQGLTRNGFQNGSPYADMDILKYDYDNGNKLLKVTDAGNKAYGFKEATSILAGNDYRYDDNGNMVMAKNKGIGSITEDGITYNYLNLPTEVSINNAPDIGTISYIYDATGVKLRKIVSTGATTDYAGNYIYENNVLQMFHHAEGYLEPVIASGSAATSGYNYIYQYKDHLGNIRVNYTDINQNNANAVALEIVEEKNYYPFGLQHKGYNSNVNGIQNSYLTYNGKEFDMSLNMNMYDLGARMYDPTIGRFMAIDPMTDFVTYQSPYVMADNNPIFFVDEYGFGKCGWLCRTFNRLVYGKDKLIKQDVNKGRLKRKYSQATGWVINDKKPKEDKEDKEDCTDCGSIRTEIDLSAFNFGNLGIGQVDGPNFGPTIANPLETPERPTRRARVFGVPTVAGQSLTTPVNVRFTGSQGTILNRNNPISQRTLTALLATLTADPNLSILISSNYFTTGSIAWPATQRRGNAQNNARANAIRAFLEQHGIDPNRISIGQGSLNRQTRAQQTVGQRSNQNITITKNQ